MWTYDPLLSTLKDKVRFIVGDTDQNNPLVSDYEILYALSVKGQNPICAASLIAFAISAKLSKEADKAIGDLKISLSQRAQNYYRLGETLKKECKDLKVGLPVFEETPPKFSSEMFTHPKAVGDDDVETL